MKEEFLKILNDSLNGIELTNDESRFIEWISRMDLWTVQQTVQIIEKCRGAAS